MWWFLLFPLLLFGAYEGSPAMPAELEAGIAIPDTRWYCVRIGEIQDWVLYNRLKGSAHQASLSGWDALGTFDWTIVDRLDLEFRLGEGALSGRWKEGSVAVNMTGETGFVWAGAAKIVFLESADTCLGAQVQGGGWEFMSAHFSLDGVPQSEEGTSRYLYAQGSVGIVQKIGFLRPYVNFIVDQIRFRVEREKGVHLYFDQRHRIGSAIGVSLSTGEKWLIALETRQGFEEAISFSGQLRF